MFTLLIVGILWIRSEFWSFSNDDYINQVILDISRPFEGSIDLELLKSESTPAYE